MRKWIVVGVAAVVVLVLAVSAFASGGSEEEAGSKPLLITTAVEQRDLRDEVTVTGTLGRVEQRAVNAAAPAAVSKVYVSDGAELNAGQAILALDGRDSVTETGDVGFFRKLDVGASGVDVLQLEQILQASGYSPGAVDQAYTEQTRAALGQWQAAHGYPGGAPQTEQSMTVSLSPGNGYKIGPRSSAGVIIRPRAKAASSANGSGHAKASLAGFKAPNSVKFLPCAPPTQVSISGTASINEGTSTVITVTTDNGPATCPTTVALSYSGTATPGADYTVPTASVTFNTGETVKSFVFQTLNDALAETPETADISIVPNPDYIINTGTATVTINDSLLPVVTLTPSVARVNEGQPIQFTVGLDRALAVSFEVFLGFSGDAVEGTHYSRPAGLFIIPAGQTTLPITIPTLDNALVEFDHTLGVALAASPSYTIGSPNGANVTIVSEDVPEININGGATSLGKGGAAVYTIVANQPPIYDTTIQYSAQGIAKPGVDVAPLTGTVLMKAGTTSVSVRIFALNTDVIFLPTDMIVAQWPTRIGSTLVKEGDGVAAGQPLFSITETGFTVTLKASASDRTKLAVGQQVTVTVQGGTSSATGVITELDESATIEESGAQSYQGKVQVQGELGAADGAAVTIDVVLEERLGVLTVPIAAVKQNGEGQDVVRIIDLKRGGRITEVVVETGLAEASYIEIKSGLKGDEVVVVEVDQATG